MATTIVTKNGSGAPTASDLVAGELAVDLTNKRLYTEDSGGTVLELGTNPSGNVTFGDNGKAIFGAGSDLSLYHVGGNSYVLSNTGSLILRSDSFRVLNTANSEQILHGDANGAVTAYYDNAVKLATTATGIDVTGGVTASNSLVITGGITGHGANRATFSQEGANGAFIQSYGANTSTMGAFSFRQASSDFSITATPLTIDASGNLLVGKSTTAFGTAGIALRGTVADFTRDGGTPINVNRLTSDGSLIDLHKDGAVVGSIGTLDGNSIYIGNGEVNLRMIDVANDIRPVTSSGTNRDAAVDLGDANARFKDLYRSGSTISTSDRNMKQDERNLTEAEATVAQACKSLLRAFRFIDAVEKDGDGARIHFGIVAQDLQAAFEAEGLDATNYAMFRPSTYTDENGNEQTRLGVCYENLLAFIIAAI